MKGNEMKIDNATVERIAELAKLEFDEHAKEEVKADLNKMLEFVEQLNEVDTSTVEPLTHMVDEAGELREDVVKNEISTEKALQNAPKKDSDYFKVPKVIDKAE